jgi:riboflavin synthase
VAQLQDDGFAADVSLETERRTTLGQLRTGARVNLERALAVGERLGGHFVSGHVDGICQIESVRPLGSDRLVRVRASRELMPLIAVKGSVSLDGVSLTVNVVRDDGFDLMLIPHTLATTTLSALAPGQSRNLEVDVLARYVARALGRA